MSDSRVTLPVATIAQAIRLRYPLYSAVSDEHLIDIFAGENPQCRLVREGGKVSLENLSSIFSQDANSQAEGVTPRSEPVPTSEADKPLAESQERKLRVPKRVIAVLVGLTAITLLAAVALIVYSKHGISTKEQTALDQALSPTTSGPGLGNEIPAAHEKTPQEVWSEASPTTRRTTLASHVRETWKNVRVENSGVVMTITHPGMDEEGAHKIIDDIGMLAREAGLRRINFVSAGGICQITYTYPYCDYACPEEGYCLASESHPCLTCCLIHGNPISQIPVTRQEPCPPHTWVYDVPVTSDSPGTNESANKQQESGSEPPVGGEAAALNAATLTAPITAGGETRGPFSYSCENGTAFAITFHNTSETYSASFNINGGAAEVLTSVRAGSGSHYSGNRYSFDEWHGEVHLTDNTKAPSQRTTSCSLLPR